MVGEFNRRVAFLREFYMVYTRLIAIPRCTSAFYYLFIYLFLDTASNLNFFKKESEDFPLIY